MRFTSFLLGGIAGAAAVVYLSGRNKSMLWSAFTNNASLGNMMNQMNGNASAGQGTSQFANSGSQPGTTNNMQASNQAGRTGNAKTNNANNAGGMYKVADIVNQDPKLKSQVEQMMGGNNQKEELQLQ